MSVIKSFASIILVSNSKNEVDDSFSKTKLEKKITLVPFDNELGVTVLSSNFIYKLVLINVF